MIDWTEDHSEWIRKQIGLQDFPPKQWTTAGVRCRGELVGAVILYDWTPEAVCFGAAATSSRWLTRELMAATVRRAFDFLQVRIAIAHTTPDNTRTKRLLTKLGFVQTGVIKEGLGAGLDLLVYTLERHRALELAERMEG